MSSPAMRSFLGVPIMSRGRVFGHLYLTEKQGAEEFSKEDEQLAVTLAGQAAELAVVICANNEAGRKKLVSRNRCRVLRRSRSYARRRPVRL